MIQIEVKVPYKSGLHARLAADLVKIAQAYECRVDVCKDHDCVDAKSIMGILTLAAGYQSALLIVVDGPEEDKAIEAIASFFRPVPEHAGDF